MPSPFAAPSSLFTLRKSTVFEPGALESLSAAPPRKPAPLALTEPTTVRSELETRATMPPTAPFHGRAAIEPLADTCSLENCGTRTTCAPALYARASPIGCSVALSVTVLVAVSTAPTRTNSQRPALPKLVTVPNTAVSVPSIVAPCA